MKIQEMDAYIDYHEKTKEHLIHVKKAQKELSTVKDYAKEVYEALENKRHTLPIEGTKCKDSTLVTVLCQEMPKLNKMAKIDNSEKKKALEKLEKLQSSLEITKEISEENKKLLKKAKSQALKEASIKLSLKMAESEQTNEELLPMPPAPKLIDF